jgi:phosphoribosylanthranilate isomerase
MIIKVKLCGNRNWQDVEITRDADAQGFVVETPRSPRNIPLGSARALIRAVPLFNMAVIVTATTEPQKLAYVVARTQPDALQIHSELQPEQIERIHEMLPARVRLYSLLSVLGPEEDLIEKAKALASSSLDAIILDTSIDGQSGGTGVPHDWQLSRKIRDAVYPFPVIIAGGLTPDNVIRAMEIVRPYAIDVASSVEEGGAKSPRLVQSLLRQVRSYAYAEARVE